MLAAMTLLLGCQFAGEVVVRLTGLSFPGPVVGMLLLLAILIIRGGVPPALDGVTGGLLSHLSLLFVPACVGVMNAFGLIADQWRAIAVTVVLSTLATLAVTALVTDRIGRAGASDADGDGAA